MEGEPGPSKRVKYSTSQKKPLTDEELLASLEDSETEADDPFANDSDDDPDYTGEDDAIETEDEEEAQGLGFQTSSALLHSASPTSLPQTSTTCLLNPPQTSEWSYDEVQSQNFAFTKKEGLLVSVNIATEPIEYFNLLATDDFLNMLCIRTNNHAIDLISKGSGEEPRIVRWKDVTLTEMKTFLGVLFHMGTIKLNRLNDYWKKHYMFNLHCFSSFMSRNRFLLILRALNFENIDEENRTRVGKIMPLINFFNNRMNECYYPSRELSIDESMVLWRGRLRFRQYIKGKRHKFGIKLYVLCEPKGIALKIIMYTGSADPELSGSQHTEKVVLALLADKLDSGHSVFMDNYYNSVNLTKELLKRNTYVTGTLRSNRKNNPAEVIIKKLKKEELIVQYNSQGICVLKWKDRRAILAISSEYTGQLQNVTTQRGVEKSKPNKYNDYMAGVDHCDQMLSYYSCEHKTLIWYKKLALHLFQMMLLNSYYLYKQGNPDNKKSLYDYRLSVIEKLLGPPQADPLPKIRVTHLPELCPKSDGEKSRIKRRRCQVCWLNDNTRKDSIYYCALCPNQPGLCLTPCFRIFHSKN
jgi:hypothetical protein